jgi:hypothetical protein
MVRPVALCCLALMCGSAAGGIVHGTDAQDQFAGWHASLGGSYLDFESVPAGTNLMPGTDPFGVGARFASVIYTNGNPFGPEHVEVSNRHGYATYGNTIVGSPFQYGVDDGRVGYEIRFDNPQGRAGILRAWNTSAVTKFYNAAGELLGEHVNTTNVEFVAWLADPHDPASFVSRMVMDGLAPGGTRQVGYSDDLYFGLDIPTPGSATLVLLGLIAAGERGRGRAG